MRISAGFALYSQIYRQNSRGNADTGDRKLLIAALNALKKILKSDKIIFIRHINNISRKSILIP